MVEPLILPKTTDYWDTAKEAVLLFASQLRESSPEDARLLASEISAGVTEHVRVLTDLWLPRAAFVVAEDLYRTANTVSVWNSSVADYLACSAAVFFAALARRGLQLHYVIDNSFADMQRPIQLFPLWFRACGLHYECPQLHQSSGASAQQSRAASTKQLRAASASGRHYLFLDTDSDDSSFEAPLEQLNTKGVLTIIRNEAPGPGSKALVYLSGKQLA